jgi:hypothetical protein
MTADPPQSPSAYACHGARWAIRREWTAARIGPRGQTLRIVTAPTEAALIAALDAAEAALAAEPG